MTTFADPTASRRQVLSAAALAWLGTVTADLAWAAPTRATLPVPRDRTGPRGPRRPRPQDGTLFVAVDGSNAAGDGSVARPWRTVQRAYRAARPGDVIFLRGGTYPVTDHVVFDRRAERDRRLTIASYPGEWAVLDFSPASGTQRVWLRGARWHVLRDLEIRNSPAQGVVVTDGDRVTAHNDVVNVVARDCNGSGFQVYRGHHHRFIECLAVFTRAPDSPGDADGFDSVGRGGPSTGNAFYRCVSVDAPDDGFDGWEGDHTTWVACWAIRSGAWGGNGNGFKAGPGPGARNSVWETPPPQAERNRTDNRLHFCVALDCVAVGFDTNGGTDNHLLHDTAAGCATAFAVYPLTDRTRGTNVLVNNLAVGAVYRDGRREERRNSWNAATEVEVSTRDFRSLEAPPTDAFLGLTGRQAYRLLAERSDGLARLRRSSDAVGAGARGQASYRGDRPDLGAFERGW